ncbi:MAG: hypothetical protein ACYDGR_17115 [Candidatus Dormibacteria bacterium]
MRTIRILATLGFLGALFALAAPVHADNCDLTINPLDCQNTAWAVGSVATLAAAAAGIALAGGFLGGPVDAAGGDGPHPQEPGGGSSPVVPVPPVTTQATAPGCTCTCTVSIDGPTDLGVCECEKGVTYSISGGGSSYATLHAQNAQGSELFSRKYHAVLQVHCAGGTDQRENATFAWSVTPTGTGFTVGLNVVVPCTCADGTATSCSCTAPPLQVATHPAKSIVSVILLDTRLIEIGHVAIQVTCGEQSTIYSYYPADRADFLHAFKGQPGSVEVQDASGTNDQIGVDYSRYYPDHDKLVYIIDGVGCQAAQRLRAYWESLRVTRGTYVLASSNCATRAFASLVAAGIPVDQSHSGPVQNPGEPTTPTEMDAVMDYVTQGSLTDPQGNQLTVNPMTTVPAVVPR